MVTAADITRAIRELGVRPGEHLVVHSSLKSFGQVEGGAETVARALMQSGANVFMPVFNYDIHPFDAAATPSLTGAITEAFRKLPDVSRSLHPTHSWAGFGPEAAKILQGHERVHPFGMGSPLWKLWQRNAWVLLMGVDHRASSMIHVAEEFVQVPYLNRTRVARIVRDGKIDQIVVRKPGCDFAFNRIDPLLRKNGRITDAQVGQSRWMLLRSGDIVQAAADLLRHDPAALLCNLEDGGVCDEARRLIEGSRT